MKLTTLLTINAIVSALFAALTLIIPAQFLAFYGIDSDPIDHLMTRYFGAMLVGNVLWLLFARRIVEPASQRLIILIAVVNWLLILAVNLWATLGGLPLVPEWNNTILALLFLAGYAYCWMKSS